MTQHTKLMFAAVTIATLFLGACEPAATTTGPLASPSPKTASSQDGIPVVPVVPVPARPKDLAAVPEVVQAPPVKAEVVKTQPVDIVICLDASGSMSGLIGAAKQKLWAIVNELATANPRPKLRVGLYQYGGSEARENGYVVCKCELTDDLDAVYDKLFEIGTRGGTEYVARVISKALSDQEWSEEKNALKLIIVAGNEAATQDPTIKLEEICKKTIAKGIMVNTIYCGPVAAGQRTGWAAAATWADGQYAAIDHNNGTVAIQTPHDKEIAQLGSELNKTYIAFGRDRKKSANQSKQDMNAASVGAPAAAERAVAKSGKLYNNSSWDLVDAQKNNKDFDLAKVPEKDLPETMRAMTPKEREAYVATQAANRVTLQTKIQTLNKKRQEHIQAEMKKNKTDDSKSFDANLRKQIRSQAEKKGFEFEQ